MRVTVLALDSATLGATIPFQSIARLRVMISMLDFLHLEPALFPHSLAQPDLIVLSLGMARPGLVSSLFVLDLVHSNLPVLLHSFTQPTLPVPVPDFAHLESFMPPQSLLKLGVMMPILDSLHLDTMLLSQNFA